MKHQLNFRETNYETLKWNLEYSELNDILRCYWAFFCNCSSNSKKNIIRLEEFFLELELEFFFQSNYVHLINS